MREAMAPLVQAAARLMEAPDPQPVEAVPPLAELVNDDDIEAALEASYQAGGQPATKAGGYDVTALRAALEAYGTRLLARPRRTP